MNKESISEWIKSEFLYKEKSRFTFDCESGLHYRLNLQLKYVLVVLIASSLQLFQYELDRRLIYKIN
jgi:hypothetical protein